MIPDRRSLWHNPITVMENEINVLYYGDFSGMRDITILFKISYIFLDLDVPR